jgi:hypothetical protein
MPQGRSEATVTKSCTAFADGRMIAHGPLAEVAPAVKTAYDAGTPRLLVFDDADGSSIELDLRGTVNDVVARLPVKEPSLPSGRGRPRLGVTSREVTLLPV